MMKEPSPMHGSRTVSDRAKARLRTSWRAHAGGVKNCPNCRFFSRRVLVWLMRLNATNWYFHRPDGIILDRLWRLYHIARRMESRGIDRDISGSAPCSQPLHRFLLSDDRILVSPSLSGTSR